jgi:hypothetical protein
MVKLRCVSLIVCQKYTDNMACENQRIMHLYLRSCSLLVQTVSGFDTSYSLLNAFTGFDVAARMAW